MSTLKSVNLQHPSSASPNIVLDSSGNVTAAGTVAMATPFAMRNKIINGAMEISQRGTSFPAIAASTYSLDRWFFGNVGAGVLTASQQTDVPTGQGFQNSLRLAVTTADTSIAATDLCNIQQRIEGYNVTDLVGKTFTLSFWVRSSKTGIHCVAFKNAGTAGVPDRSYVLEYTVSAANTWEFKTLSVSGGLTTAGTWDFTNGIGLSVIFSLAAGSNFQTTAGAWQTGNLNATANQVNCLDTIGNIFALTGVQLEVGSVATPFERRLYGTELQLAQRYYYRQNTLTYFNGNSGNSTVARGGAKFAVTMRATPTIIVNPGSNNGGTDGQAYISNINSNTNITSVSTITDDGFDSIINSSNLPSSSYLYAVSFRASAEL